MINALRLLITAAIMYGCCAFFYMNFDPHTWSYFARAVVVSVPGLVLLFIAMGKLDKWEARQTM